MLYLYIQDEMDIHVYAQVHIHMRIAVCLSKKYALRDCTFLFQRGHIRNVRKCNYTEAICSVCACECVWVRIVGVLSAY